MNFTYWLYCPRVRQNVIVIAKFTLPIGNQESHFVRIEHCTKAPPCKNKYGDCQAAQRLDFDSSERRGGFEQQDNRFTEPDRKTESDTETNDREAGIQATGL